MLYFSNIYYQVIVSGDLSGTAVHPFFIHFANLAGCHIYQQHQQSFSLLATEAMHLRLTLAQLDNMQEEDDPVAFSTAHALMAIASFCTHMFPTGLRYLRTAIGVLDKRGIDLCSIETTRDFSGSNHQKFSLLMSILYAETLLQIVLGCGQGMAAKIEHQFRYDVPVSSF
jgi:hypothetical protein